MLHRITHYIYICNIDQYSSITPILVLPNPCILKLSTSEDDWHEAEITSLICRAAVGKLLE